MEQELVSLTKDNPELGTLERRISTFVSKHHGMDKLCFAWLYCTYNGDYDLLKRTIKFYHKTGIKTFFGLFGPKVVYGSLYYPSDDAGLKLIIEIVPRDLIISALRAGQYYVLKLFMMNMALDVSENKLTDDKIYWNFRKLELLINLRPEEVVVAIKAGIEQKAISETVKEKIVTSLKLHIESE
ncbi:unnamed protein product [Blepharisma stoltei]|uniref:Uncharacterized protein n=1 Tax=Blepharisma stoltei TaxID=1481888 RepID=A0AAU9JZC0_9CILI|nr:unnamed protein product [Blepharisma stoltei]